MTSQPQFQGLMTSSNIRVLQIHSRWWISNKSKEPCIHNAQCTLKSSYFCCFLVPYDVILMSHYHGSTAKSCQMYNGYSMTTWCGNILQMIGFSGKNGLKYRFLTVFPLWRHLMTSQVKNISYLKSLKS